MCIARRGAQGAVRSDAASRLGLGDVMIIGGMTQPLSTSSPSTLPSGALRLADWGLIQAQGPEAAGFLQGQLTQDVTALSTQQARLAGFCSAKGRLQASFVFWRGDADTILLACSADLLAATLKRLSMFVMRAKCKLSDASADLALYGLAGAQAQAWLGDAAPAQPWDLRPLGGARVIRLPDAQGQPRYLMAQPAALPSPDLPVLSPGDWAGLEVRSGVARIVAATVDAFVPQMVNLELVGGVNFQKGCYPGQEIVARSQYRGTLKRRAQVFEADTVLLAGQEVFHSADLGQPAGRVVLAAPRADGSGSTALVEIKLTALEGGSLHADAASARAGVAALRGIALPYAIPTEAT